MEFMLLLSVTSQFGVIPQNFIDKDNAKTSSTALIRNMNSHDIPFTHGIHLFDLHVEV